VNFPAQTWKRKTGDLKKQQQQQQRARSRSTSSKKGSQTVKPKTKKNPLTQNIKKPSAFKIENPTNQEKSAKTVWQIPFFCAS